MIHLYIKELKNRASLVLVTFFSSTLITFYYKKTILYLTIKQSIHMFTINSFYFIFTNLTEIFSTYIKLNLFISTNLTLMITIWQIYFFLTPVLNNLEHIQIKKQIKKNLPFYGYYLLVQIIT